MASLSDVESKGIFLVNNISMCWLSMMSSNGECPIFPSQSGRHICVTPKYLVLISVFSPIARKHGPEKLLIRTLFTQWLTLNLEVWSLYYKLLSKNMLRKNYKSRRNQLNPIWNRNIFNETRPSYVFICLRFLG